MFQATAQFPSRFAASQPTTPDPFQWAKKKSDNLPSGSLLSKNDISRPRSLGDGKKKKSSKQKFNNALDPKLNSFGPLPPPLNLSEVDYEKPSTHQCRVNCHPSQLGQLVVTHCQNKMPTYFSNLARSISQKFNCLTSHERTKVIVLVEVSADIYFFVYFHSFSL